MKTIGVIGGIGPQATMDFEQRVHAVSQSLIPPRQNGGYPGLVVFYMRHPPLVLNEGGTAPDPPVPHPGLLDVAKKLGALADFIVITSNGAHIFQEQVEAASGLPVLSMVDAVLAEVKRRGWQTSGAIGMGEPIVYTEGLRAMGLKSEQLEPDQIAALDRALLGVMEGRTPPESVALATDAVQTLRGRGVDGVILGCTELPFLVAEVESAPDLIHPLQFLAEAAIRYALEP
jgi:aspartate racemase